MPWNGPEFAEKHNKKLKGAAADKAAAQATAMLRSGVPEGVAIATANKRADTLAASRHVADKITKRLEKRDKNK